MVRAREKFNKMKLTRLTFLKMCTIFSAMIWSSYHMVRRFEKFSKVKLNRQIWLSIATSVFLLLLFLLHSKPEQSPLWSIEETSLHYNQRSQSPGERAIEERMTQIRAACENHSNPNFKTFNLYYLPTTGVTWAPLFKAGSSTWKRFFIDQEVAANQTTNPGNSYNIHTLDRFKLQRSRLIPVNESEVEEEGRVREFFAEGEDSVRFTIVRHPLARLVSHYRNSVSPHEVRAQWDVWIRDAVNGSRGSLMPADEREKLLDEAEEYISRAARQGESSPQQDNPFLNPPYATFAEMVELISQQMRRGKNINGHWMPASQWLDICQNDFDFVLKLENAVLETPHLLFMLNLREHSELYRSRANASGSKSATNNEIEWFLKQLTFAQQNRLNEIYALDYEAFGYKPIIA